MRVRRTWLIGLLILILAAGVIIGVTQFWPQARPNILIIVTDDQRYDTMEYMPRTQALIFDQGAVFNRAYVTTPLCCPSRASILTGLYVHNHGVTKNSSFLEKPTVVQTLHEEGYFTGIVGKYLNSYPREEAHTQLAEFDFWVAHGGVRDKPGAYFKYEMNVQGEWVNFRNEYLTYVERDYVLEFLDQAAEQKKPFFLIFTPYAPHYPSDPAPEDVDLYPDMEPHRPLSFDEADVSDKPGWIQDIAPLSEESLAGIETNRRREMQSLASVDRAIEEILTRLDEQGELDNTVVIFISDNGELWGEHRLRGKKSPYEESVRVPMAIRYPRLIGERQEFDQLVANIDLVPTIYDLARVRNRQGVDGRSLVPLLRGEDIEWREDLVIESWHLGNNRGSWVGLHTGRYVYIQSLDEQERLFVELYDLEKDPYQMNSVADDPEYADIREDLERRLAGQFGIEAVPTLTVPIGGENDQ